MHAWCEYEIKYEENISIGSNLLCSMLVMISVGILVYKRVLLFYMNLTVKLLK